MHSASRSSMESTCFMRKGPRAAARISAPVIGALLLLALTAGAALAATPPPVQIYYVPYPEDQVLSTLQTLYESNAVCGGGSPRAQYPVTSFVSISAPAEGTIIYYDHWEDGFEADLANPVQATTQIWGDGDASNGTAPGIPSDILGGDAVIILQSRITDRAVVDFDGGDKIGASRVVAVTRAAWAAGPDTRHAGAVEVYPTDKWGTEYETPVGQDIGLNSQVMDIFSYTALAIMASQNGTTVAIDTDADGTADVNTTVNEGQSVYVPDLMLGGTVQASAPVQVTMVTGERCENYESRWYNLFARDMWSDSYYNPVSKMPGASVAMTETTVFLHNPNDTAITVEYETVAGLQPPINVPASATSFVTMPVDSGAHFFTTDSSVFQAIAAVDTMNDRNKDADWGLTLTPANQLTRQTLIGWGAGRDPTSDINPDENGSPVWVMPVYTNGAAGPIQVCVDFNGDNTPGFSDGNGFYYDLLLTLNEFETARVYDPDGDQTGMLLYACDPSTGVAPDVKLAAAWGQAPGDASLAQPGLDLGTAAPPAATFSAGKMADVAVDVNGDGYATPGDTLEYRIVLRNTSRVIVQNAAISDTVPLFTSYVTNTTTLDDGSGVLPIPDDASGTPFPLDDGGIALGDLPVRGAYTVTFQVLIDDPYGGGQENVRNVAYVTAEGETILAIVETNVYSPGLQLEKTPSLTFVESPQTEVTYTYTATNTGLEPLSDVTLVDDMCTPVVYQRGDTDVNDVLDSGEAWIYTCSMVVSYPTTNIAVVSGIDTLGTTITATATAFVDTGIVWLAPIFQLAPVACPPPDGCPLEGKVKGMAVHQVTGDLFVASREVEGVNPDQLLKVDPFTMEIEAKVATGQGSQPWGVVVNEKTNRVYVSNWGTAEVVIYDADTLAELKRISVDFDATDGKPAWPGRMAILPELDTVFVVVRGESRVAVIKGLELKENIPAGGSGPFGIAADPVRNLIYISHRDSRSFSMLRHNGSGWQAQQGPLFGDGRYVFGLDYNPNEDASRPGILYSVWASAENVWYVSLWEPDPAKVDWGLLNELIVPSGGAVDVMGVGGDGIVVNPETGTVFNANTGDDSVTVIKGDGSEYLDQLGVSDDPFAAAVDADAFITYIGLRAPGAVVKLLDLYR